MNSVVKASGKHLLDYLWDECRLDLKDYVLDEEKLNKLLVSNFQFPKSFCKRFYTEVSTSSKERGNDTPELEDLYLLLIHYWDDCSVMRDNVEEAEGYLDTLLKKIKREFNLESPDELMEALGEPFGIDFTDPSAKISLMECVHIFYDNKQYLKVS